MNAISAILSIFAAAAAITLAIPAFVNACPSFAKSKKRRSPPAGEPPTPPFAFPLGSLAGERLFCS